MKTNIIDPQYDYYDGSVIEEIVNKLLDGDKSRVDDIESVLSAEGNLYVSIKRSEGKKIVHYKREERKKLVAMSPEEIKLLQEKESNPFSYSYSKNGYNLTGYDPIRTLLNVLSGNGYSVKNVDVIKSVGFDFDTPLKVTKVRNVGGDMNSLEKFYIIKSDIVYLKMGK
jgi:hypothetical protein